MIKKIAAASAAFLSVFIIVSCTVVIADRPDYYRDFDDKATAATGYNYSYSAAYNSAAYAAPTATPVPYGVSFLTLKVTGNTYYFYEGEKEVAFWKFMENGSVLKKGKVISGLVRRFYDGTGVTESEIMFKDGERWGLCSKYYPNGMLKERINYYNGDRDGNYMAFYPNGKMMEEGAFKKGSRFGNYKKYVETGELQEKGVYENNAPKVLFSKAAAPVAAQAQTAVGNENHPWSPNKKGGDLGVSALNNSSGAATAVVTQVPAAAATQAVEHAQVAAMSAKAVNPSVITSTAGEIINSNKMRVKASAKDAKGNTLHAAAPWSAHGKMGFGKTAKSTTKTAESGGTTMDAKNESREIPAGKDGDNRGKQDQNTAPPENKTGDK